MNVVLAIEKFIFLYLNGFLDWIKSFFYMKYTTTSVFIRFSNKKLMTLFEDLLWTSIFANLWIYQSISTNNYLYAFLNWIWKSLYISPVSKSACSNLWGESRFTSLFCYFLGLDRTLICRGGLVRKRRVTFFRRGCNFYLKNELKSETFNNAKSWYRKIFSSIITKNSNWEILTKNLVTF